MEMSEPYATTVAAVAPVVWAIGTVEVHQVIKRMRTVCDDRDRLVTECLRALAVAHDDTGLAQARRDWKAIRRQDRRAWPSTLLYVAWSYLGIAMIFCVVSALGWLAERGGPGKISGTDPTAANFCLLAITTGLVFITLLPMAVATAEAIRSLRRARTKQREFARREAETASRIEALRSANSGLPSSDPPTT
ncbi:hypothetical protein ACQPZG_16670 [Streptomyces sp. CA-294286]|uniref:hypothetical protein n=1 Tax=Streptomyces sp. CA-294286 TaxID=3240070 RepID=UPI003D8BA675